MTSRSLVGRRGYVREISYIQIIWEEAGNRIRKRILIDRGRVVDFVIQYETDVDGIYRPVVRYDGSHGHGHRDILNLQGETVDKWWVPEHMDLGDALEYGSDDLDANWRRYRDRFLERYT
jgi:hypothetical protein